MRKLKCGIIGLGGIGTDKHLPEYAKLKEDVEIAAICDADENMVKQTLKQYAVPHAFTNYKDLLALKEIDFVCVCLPNFLHAPVTIEALMAGKHVHCEKPMARNAVEAREMVRAKNASGKKLMIGLNNRFTPATRYVDRYIRDGNLGDIYFAKCGWVRRKEIAPRGWFLEKVKSGGGPLIDLGVHVLDMVMSLMDFPELKSVTARTYSKFINSDLRIAYSNPGAREEDNNKFNVEDLAVGFIELQKDISLQFEASWASNIEREKAYYEIYGTKGGVRYTKFPGIPAEVKIFTVMNGQHVDMEPKLLPVVFDPMEFTEFVSCIREDREPKLATPEQAVKIMELIDAIYKSAEIKKQIAMP